MRRTAIAGAAFLTVLIGTACDDDTASTDGTVVDGKTGDGKTGDGKIGDGKTGDGKTGDGKTGDGKTGDGTPSDGSGWDFFLPDAMNPGNLVPCGPSQTVYQCSNGMDDDGDKLIDAMDPECTGPCDNSEGSFELSIPGVNKDCKQDCYWDYDSGGGNDDCDWNHKCDPLSPGTSYKPSCAYDAAFTQCTTTQSKICLDLCIPLTPNGCDCFGCCEVYVGGKKYKDTIYLGSGTTCTAKTPQNCAPCTQQTSCANGCGVCELCLGKTIKDLPPSCFKPPAPDGGPTDAKPADIKPPWDGWKPPDQGLIIPWICPPGVKNCLTNNDCPASYYCITGCCQLTIS